MRAISISESYLHKDTCAVYEAKVYTDAKSKDISIFIEAFPPGITVAIDITVDKWLLKEFENPIDFETKILESLRTFSKVIEDEETYGIPRMPRSIRYGLRIYRHRSHGRCRPVWEHPIQDLLD